MATKPKRLRKTVQGSILNLNLWDTHNVNIDMSKLSPEIVKEAIIHGLTSKIGDTLAFTPPEEREKVFTELVNRITSPNGAWVKPKV